MARLFPKIDPEEIENPGERKVAKALVEQLPSRIEVFHSFNWIKTNEKGRIIQGECDFVILDPENGILFVEVKGGSLEFFPQRMEWVRIYSDGTENPLTKDPFDQVRSSMYAITKRIGSRGPRRDGNLPFTCSYAVAFPDCTYTGSLPMSMTPDLVLDANRCLDLRSSVQKVFDRFRKTAHSPISSGWADAIHEALFPKYGILPVIWRKVEDQEERLRRMTAEQQQLLVFLSQHNKAAIRGVAGSGKTILALAKAQETARNGLRTLFLCYNKQLKDWLEKAMPDSFQDRLVIDNFHGLVDELCTETGVPFWEHSKEEGFWTDGAAEYLMDACDRLEPEKKFDAVIVDEGQDFHPLWWTSMEDLFKNPDDKGCYYVFYDPNQNLFVDTPSLPGELGSPFDLPVNCRNTVKIAGHCAALVGQENQTREGAPLGDAPEMITVSSIQEGFKQAGKRVRNLCMPNAGGLKTSQVAVLAPGSTERSWSHDFNTVPVTKSLDVWRENGGVLLSSWGRFKGLEADAIIILETDASDDPHEVAARYVARSRAKHLLTVIQVENS